MSSSSSNKVQRTDSNTQRTKPSLSLNFSNSNSTTPTTTTTSSLLYPPHPPIIDTTTTSPNNITTQRERVLPPPPLVPPPALKPPPPLTTTTSGSGWSANYNSSPSTNVNYRETDLSLNVPAERTQEDPKIRLEQVYAGESFSTLETKPLNVGQQLDPVNQSKSVHGRAQNSISPTSVTESPPFLPWRDGHRRRDSSASINSEYALSALPSPSISSMNIWGFTPGGPEAGNQDWAGPNAYRRKSNETFANGETPDLYARRAGTPDGGLARLTSAVAIGHSASMATSLSSPSISSGLARGEVISGSGRRFSSDGPAKPSFHRTAPYDDPSLVAAGTTAVTPTSSRDPSFPSTASEFSNAQNVMLLPSVVMPSDISSWEHDGSDRDDRCRGETAQLTNSPVSNASSPPPTYARNSSTSPPQDFPLMRRSSGSLPSPRPPPALLPMEGLNRRSSERRAPPRSERRQYEAAAAAAAVVPAAAAKQYVPCLHHERPHDLATPPSTRNVSFPSRAGPYTILRCLGSGSFSKVYLASREVPWSCAVSPASSSASTNAPQPETTCAAPPTSLSDPINIPPPDSSSRPQQRSPEPKDDRFAIKAIPRASILEDSRLKASVDRETHLLEYANGHPGVVRFVDVFSIATDGTICGSPRTTMRRNGQGGEPEYSPENSSPDAAATSCSSSFAVNTTTSTTAMETTPKPSFIDGWECLVLEYVQGGELFDWIMRRFTGIPKSKEKKIEDEAQMNRTRNAEASRDVSAERERERERENTTGSEVENLNPRAPTDRREAEEEGAEERKKRIWNHERDVKEVFRQLLDVVWYLHSRNIVHRDLKLENILITANPIPNTSSSSSSTSRSDAGKKSTTNTTTAAAHEPPPRIKLTDFGLARFIDPSSPFLTTRCGSEEYAAAEIISGQPYDARLTDAWALGVILYACLTGGLPFVTEAGERRRKYLGRIARGEFKWPQGTVRVWQPGPPLGPSIPHDYWISNEAKQVVEGLLTSSPRSRWTLDKALQSPWLRESRG